MYEKTECTCIIGTEEDFVFIRFIEDEEMVFEVRFTQAQAQGFIADFLNIYSKLKDNGNKH